MTDKDETILKFLGPEHVREVVRSDLGVVDSDEILTWSEANGFICPTGLKADEVLRLTTGAGQSWEVVSEETSTAVSDEQLSLKGSVDVVDESASEQAEPQEASGKRAASKKPPQA